MEDYRKIAIELGQTLINKAPETRGDVERMLPELKESEDEKIRKEIIIYLKSVISNKKFGDEIIESWIDWLEKQSEKNEEILVLKDQIESLHAAIKAIKETHRIELEKQSEQQTAWSEDDDEMLDSIIDEVRYMGDFPYSPTKEENELYDECLAKVEWLNSLKDRVQPQSQWKPSDEQMKALKHAFNDCSIAFADMKILATLYEQLKALHRYEQDT